MKEKLTNNVGLKIISALLAVLLWLVVVNISDPVITDVKDGIPIEVLNEDVLSDKQMSYEIVGKKTVSVSYDVKKLDAYKIKASDFRAYVDLNDMWDVTNSIPVRIEIVNNKGLISTQALAKPGVIQVKTDAIQKKQFDLEVTTIGKPAEGYALGETTMTPSYVYVTGPVSVIGGISYVGIEIDVEGATADMAGVTKPILYDANGNKLDLNSSVSFNKEDISYNVIMLKVKNLSLDFEVSGKVADGYRYTGVECELNAVSIAGFKSVLAELTKITIPGSELSLDGATGDKVYQIDLMNYLPAPNVTLVGMNSSVLTVTLKVEPLSKKTFTLSEEDVTFTGKIDNYSYTFLSGPITVTVQGLKEDLDKLDNAGLKAVVEVANMLPGSQPANIYFTLDEVFKLVEYTPVTLEIKSNIDETVAESSTEESSTNAPTTASVPATGE